MGFFCIFFMKKNAVVRKILFTISLVCLCCAVTQRAVPQKAGSPDSQETGTVKTVPLRPLPDGFLTGLIAKELGVKPHDRPPLLWPALWTHSI